MGYIIIVIEYKGKSTIVVTTINGELISIIATKSEIYTMVLDRTGYNIIVGGKNFELG